MFCEKMHKKEKPENLSGKKSKMFNGGNLDDYNGVTSQIARK